MSQIRALHQAAYIRQNPLFLIHPDDTEAALIHPCVGCNKLTVLPQYCAICAEEIEALRQMQQVWPRPSHSPVFVPPHWQPFAVDMIALLIGMAFCWLCCAL